MMENSRGSSTRRVWFWQTPMRRNPSRTTHGVIKNKQWGIENNLWGIIDKVGGSRTTCLGMMWSSHQRMGNCTTHPFRLGCMMYLCDVSVLVTCPCDVSIRVTCPCDVGIIVHFGYAEVGSNLDAELKGGSEACK